MTIKDIVEALKLEVACGENLLDRTVIGGYVGDLLSVVMGKAQEDNVWITVQGHINIIAVASLINVSCIIVSEGFDIEEDSIKKAIEEDIVLLRSSLSSYEICKELTTLGV